MPDKKPPMSPDIVTPDIELEGFDGLSVKIDLVNRAPSSWRRLENFDLFTPGSVRKIAPPTLFSGPFPAAMMTIAEFKTDDTSERVLYGIGTDGKLYDLSNPSTAGIDLGVGNLLQPVFTALMPGVKIPYDFVSWKPAFAVTVGQAIISISLDGDQYIFECTTGGLTNALSAPQWPTSGTVADGTVVWTNRGLLSDKTWLQNYLAIIVPGFQPIKFDGTAVTDIGVTAPEVSLDIDDDLTIITTDVSKGIMLNTGRYYSWTWFNPTTLHESALAPVTGTVTFFSSDPNVNGSQSIKGSFLHPNLVVGYYYSQIGLTIPKALVQSPAIGDGYTHVRFYATLDGGSQLFLLQTLYDSDGNIITDGNGAIAIANMEVVQDYEAVSITQAPQDCVAAFDGVDDGKGFVSQDTMPTNNDLLTEGPRAFVHLVKGTLTVDTDQAAHISQQAYFTMRSPQAASLGTDWSIEIRMRTSDTIIGTVIASYEDTQTGPSTTNDNSDRYLWMTKNGHVHFAYRNASGLGWIQFDHAATLNDGNPHVIDIVCQTAVGVVLYVDGIAIATNAAVNNPGFIGYWRFGYGDISNRGEINNKPASDYYMGVLDEIAWWAGTANDHTIVANNAAQAITNGNYGGVIIALSPTDYWRLDDLSPLRYSPTPDASLVIPSNALTDNFPPPISRWGAVFQGCLFLQDDDDPNIITYSDVGEFESYGELAQVEFQTKNNDEINSLISGLNLLVISTRREVSSVSGPTPSQFTKSPIDSLHGFQGKRCVAPLGSTLVGQMRQGMTSLELSLSFGATGGNVQIGYGNGSLIGDDIQPITNTIPEDNLDLFADIAIDNTQNILIYAVQLPT